MYAADVAHDCIAESSVQAGRLVEVQDIERLTQGRRAIREPTDQVSLLQGPRERSRRRLPVIEARDRSGLDGPGQAPGSENETGTAQRVSVSAYL